MGLDVSVYTHVKKCTEGQEGSFTAFVIDKDWLHKIKNLENGSDYVGERCERGVSYAYSYHSFFRAELLRLTGYPHLTDLGKEIKWEQLTPELPFYDFINFADNEGCLDWEISAKILADFEKYFEKCESEHDENSQFRKNYWIWLTSFKIASETQGVVVFR